MNLNLNTKLKAMWKAQAIHYNEHDKDSKKVYKCNHPTVLERSKKVCQGGFQTLINYFSNIIFICSHFLYYWWHLASVAYPHAASSSFRRTKLSLAANNSSKPSGHQPPWLSGFLSRKTSGALTVCYMYFQCFELFSVGINDMFAEWHHVCQVSTSDSQWVHKCNW